MNKDVIYIDVEDDITAIIGKIKASNEKVVALVPPKHAGVLQSAVNLRLLDRMAKAEKKNLVVVSNNQALIALTAAARIPVAKNLQSKPELAEVPALAVDDGDDIIDGVELPVGEHVQSAAPKKAAKVGSTALSRPSTRTDSLETLAIDGEPVAAAAASPARKVAKGPIKGTKIPNFNKFRKRLIIAIVAGAALIALLIWAFVFAPAATIVITANTTPEPVSGTVKLGGTSATNFSSGVISSQEQQVQKNETVQFTPTGQKDEGQPATGTVTFKTNSISDLGTTIPAGTKLTSGSGLVFTTNQAVTMTSNNYTGAPVGVTAAANGTQYNNVSGSISGAPGNISATMTTPSAGGTSNIVTVVSDSDIQTALGTLSGQSTNSIQQQLTSQFGSNDVVISGSFSASQGTPTSSPASGQQLPSGQSQAALTVPVTYTMYAFPKNDLNTYLNASLNSQLNGQKNQRIYDNGLSKLGFSNFTKNSDGSMSVNITTTGQVGPDINETAVKNTVKGMVAGSVQSALQGISGVEDVQVNYPYFWVHKVPNNINKITIEFKLKNG